MEREHFDRDDSGSWGMSPCSSAGKEGRAGDGACRRAGLRLGQALAPYLCRTYASHDLVEGLARLLTQSVSLTEPELARLEKFGAANDEHGGILGDEESAEESVAAAEAVIEAIDCVASARRSLWPKSRLKRA